jgi:hypothetical protein
MCLGVAGTLEDAGCKDDDVASATLLEVASATLLRCFNTPETQPGKFTFHFHQSSTKCPSFYTNSSIALH